MIDTSRSLADTGGPNDNSEDGRYYHADPSWFEENNLSFEDVVRARAVLDAEYDLAQLYLTTM